ncbi:MAG: transglutaminase domain-containing protein [Chloroflexota bacterium]|jgi:transglutaminase-like putative cysteine protease
MIVFKAIIWAWKRFQPAEGWLSVFLILTITSMVLSQVSAAKWVPEGTIIWTALLGLLLALVLAKRPLGWLSAWSILLTYGLLMTTIWLARLFPSLDTIVSGWSPIAGHIRQNWGLFLDRFSGWLTAVFGGGSSQETIVFAFGLGLIAWLLAAYATWSTFRQRRPLAGLMALGLALAVNGYYSDVLLEPVALFIGLAALLVGVVHFADTEGRWEAKGVDYSEEIRLDILVSSASIAMFLLVLSYFVPAINWYTLSQLVLNRPAVHQAEETFDRAFAGVRQPEREQPRVEPSSDGGTTAGGFPRSYLIGHPPELLETVVMTATVAGGPPGITHWRGLSYDIYTGRGWAVSPERVEPVGANNPIFIPAYEGQVTLDQTIDWAFGESATRYTLGLPLYFDQAVSVYWRGQDDLSRVRGEGNHYSARSNLSMVPADQLRQATLAAVPPAIMARYTALPESVPERVQELAGEVADPQIHTSPYDQVKALERFLRQYPYSLEVELPPAGADPVDFFLFDLQSGYCDYYASAMVVMARTLGLPARLAAGFLAQPVGEDGVQTIRQIDGHSWAEIFFAGYGWVEFEPTATFPVRSEFDSSPIEASPFGENIEGQYIPPPIPEKTPLRWPWLLLFIPLALIFAGWYFWWRRSPRITRKDGIIWAYDRLLRRAKQLNQPTPPSQTPKEFETALLNQLKMIERGSLARRLNLAELSPDIKQVTTSFETHQYSRQKPDSSPAMESWRRIRGRLWLLSLMNRLSQMIARIESKVIRLRQ